MIEYDPTIAPIRPGQVVTWAVGEIKDASALTSALGGAHVYEDIEPDEAPARYIVVMQEQPTGGTVRTQSGARRIRFLVRVETDEETPNHKTFHAQAHEDVRGALVGKNPGIGTGSIHTPVEQFRDPDVPKWDADDHAWYSVSGYILSIQPNA